jgi:hypothetical protein
MLLSLLLLVAVLKFKSVLGLVLNSLLVSAAFGLKIFDTVQRRPDTADIVVLSCMTATFLQLGFVSAVWNLVPTAKWLKKFDLASKLALNGKPAEERKSGASSLPEQSINQPS